MQPNSQETADLVAFTEEIRNGKLHFLCSALITVGTLECNISTTFHSSFSCCYMNAKFFGWLTVFTYGLKHCNFCEYL